MALSFYYPTVVHLLCILNIEVSSAVVISFFNGANPFHRVCLISNFVRNKIYVLAIDML